MATPELTVRGAGIFGLSIAWAAVRRGAWVRVVDPYGPGAGSSGGVVGALAPHVPEQWNAKKAFQLDSLLMARDWWAEAEAASGLSAGYDRTGRLQPLADDKAVALAHARTETATTLWQGHAVWRVIKAGGDWAPPSPSGWLVEDTLTARIHPQLAVACLVAAIRAEGGEVVTEAPDHGQVIWATGHAGLLDLNQQFGKTIGGAVKGQAALLELPRPEAPQLFIDGLHIVPHADGTTAIGSTSEREWESPDSTDAQLDALIAQARTVCPALIDAPVIQRWAGLRPRARSRAPMLGAWPDRPGQFIANGGFKIGFGMAPKIAEVMADLVLDGRDIIPDAFRVEASL